MVKRSEDPQTTPLFRKHSPVVKAVKKSYDPSHTTTSACLTSTMGDALLNQPSYNGDLALIGNGNAARAIERLRLCCEKTLTLPVQNGANSATDDSSRSCSPLLQPESPPISTDNETPLNERILRHTASKDPFFSLEFFPPRTINGVSNFLSRLERMAEWGPMFIDVTWHPTGDPGSKKETSSSSIAGAALNICLVDTMLHLTCAQYSLQQVKSNLKRAYDLGIRNILALRGDVEEDNDGRPIITGDLHYATDLVRFVRKEYGNHFVIAVAGYPTGHPEAESYEEDLRHLKDKVDAGADFIVTQLFFTAQQFREYKRDCENIGITVPIIPGIMPIQSYDSLRHIVKLSKLDVPQFIIDAVEPVRQNDEAVRNLGVKMAVDLCRDLLSNGDTVGIHFYTLNREIATREILTQIGMCKESPARSRLLPWRANQQPSQHKRCREDVRPIFWSGKPKSYIYRTKDWDDFPNGRWGNITSPAYGDLKEYYLFLTKKPSHENLQKIWGNQLTCEEDIWRIFTAFVSGEPNQNGVMVKKLPWSESEDLESESVILGEQLRWCNSQGVLTINSQPGVNGAPSTDQIVGWGEPGGYVYQKAYLEFFTRRANVLALLAVLQEFPSVSCHIMNHDGTINECNILNRKPIAVTWGVFPNSEILQPTVVDPLSFETWKDEAFDPWLSQWQSIYDSDSSKDQTSKEILQLIHDNYCLVSLVDNEFPKPSCLWKLLEKMLAEAETPRIVKANKKTTLHN